MKSTFESNSSLQSLTVVSSEGVSLQNMDLNSKSPPLVDTN
uniref:Uncharacterized protein n=1 Tax=Lepeophtheirus salmonis TaxID=72036 RepID=A0A0K2V4N3_LEPSM